LAFAAAIQSDRQGHVASPAANLQRPAEAKLSELGSARDMLQDHLMGLGIA
jgi:hypothetical protein